MSALDAAETILREAGTELRARAITERALTQGLWTTAGVTPWATMASRLATDIRDNGGASRFVRTAPGLFALNPNHQTATPVVAAQTPATTAHTGTAQAPGAQPAMSFLNAAEDVLRRSPDRAPMHYRAITEQAVAEGLIASEGATPEATVRAQIGVENRRRESRGDVPRFLELGQGMIGLTEWQQEGVRLEITRHNDAQRDELLARVKAMHPRDFERLIGELLSRLDFEIERITPYGGDGGVDVRAQLEVGGVMRVKMAVQVKRWANNVRAPTVRELRGSLGAHERGLIITTSDFSGGARAEAQRDDAAPVALVNGSELTSLMIQADLGVNRSPSEVIELAPLPAAEIDEN